MGGQSDTGEGSCDEVKKESLELKIVSGPYKCNYEGCHAAFKKPSRLKQHMCSHTGERPFKCDRPNCDKAYTHACHLKRHIAISHQPHLFKKTFRCPYPGCDLMVSHDFNLKRHYRRKHEKKFTCSECGKSFEKNHLLRVHIYSHTGESPFRCEECNAGFNTQNLLRRHQRCHKKHPCKVRGCGEIFERWSDLMKHIKIAHPLEFVCDLCHNKFKTKGNLLQHIRTHMKDRPSFPCPHPECSRSYSREIYLSNHIKWIHEGLGGHKCSFDGCGRILSTKEKLMKHMAWHKQDHTMPSTKVTGESRKVRWDKGIPRRSMAGLLSGIPPLPTSLEKKLIDGQPLDTNEHLAVQGLLESENVSLASGLIINSHKASVNDSTAHKEPSVSTSPVCS